MNTQVAKTTIGDVIIIHPNEQVKQFFVYHSLDNEGEHVKTVEDVNRVLKEYGINQEFKIEKADLIRVFFKEINEYKYITLRFFDRYLHTGLITHTNHFGWFCM